MATHDVLADRPPVPTERVVLLVALATVVFHVAMARGYGYFRDELYYLVNADHLAFGYVDHPPLIGVIAAVVRATLGESLYAIRALPAIAAGVTVWLAGSMAGLLGGRRFAQGVAALAMAVAPTPMSLFSIFSMNAFDLVWWALAWWLVIRLLRGGDERQWLLFGVVAGVGLQTKISMLFLGAGLVVALVATRQWHVLRSGRFWLGGAIAGVIFAPHVWWQVVNGWPVLEFMDHARRFKNVAVSPAGFMAAQFMDVTGPHGAVVAVAGLVAAFTMWRRTPVETLGFAYVAIVLIMLAAGGAKAYYLAPIYSMVFAAGGAAIERWTSSRRAAMVRGALLALLLVLGAVAAPMAKPLLPEDAFVRYAASLGMRPSQQERQAPGRLPQFFADMHGWPELAATVAQVAKSLPAADRERACVFGQNYGEASAIEVFGPALGAPRAIAGHNSYYTWGPRGCTGEVMIVIGGERSTLDALFERVTVGTTFTCRDCMPYENNLPIWVAYRLRVPLVDAWPGVRHFD